GDPGRGGTARLPGRCPGPPAGRRAHVPNAARQSARGPGARLVGRPGLAEQPPRVPPQGTPHAAEEEPRRAARPRHRPLRHRPARLRAVVPGPPGPQRGRLASVLRRRLVPAPPPLRPPPPLGPRARTGARLGVGRTFLSAREAGRTGMSAPRTMAVPQARHLRYRRLFLAQPLVLVQLSN